jgi:hypothetical protein
MKLCALYNGASKRFEIYKVKEIEILKRINAGETIDTIADDNDEAEEDDDAGDQPVTTEEVKSKVPKIKKSVTNLNLSDCKILQNL